MDPIVIVRLSRIVVVILYAILILAVLVLGRVLAHVIQDTAESIKKDHLAVMNVISIHHVLVTLGNVVVIIMQADVQENVILTVLALVIVENALVMDMIQDVTNVILTVPALVTAESVHAMDMIQDVENVMDIVLVPVTHLNVLVTDMMPDVLSVMDILSVIVIQFVVMIVQQIMVNVL